jgi:hypothetical protein
MRTLPASVDALSRVGALAPLINRHGLAATMCVERAWIRGNDQQGNGMMPWEVKISGAIAE